ncbi:unnamed protein product [Soboliphyme baturini]|uniref:protein disulfide-isomerase n=1 Tax=Soboliphyme baturini TaxID=241478 RepID=A0A183J704_9BILA|nr:unnamed protein product [Soboliphyme baturini]
MQRSYLPFGRIVSLKDDIVKYKPDFKGFSVTDTTKFAQDYLDNKLKPYLLSQKLPKDWDQGSVKVVVAENFKKVVKDPKKNVLIMFYAPWCQHCKQLEPIWVELAEHAKHFDSDLVVAKMDATVNELEDLKITQFPTIKFFPKDSGEVVDYSGERTLEALKKFIESGGKQETEKKDSVSLHYVNRVG